MHTISDVTERLKEITLLFVEDDENFRHSMSILLAKRIKELYLADNGKEGLELYYKKKPDIIITDILMPVMSGLDMIKEIRKTNDRVPIIITSAYNDEETLLNAIDAGIDKFIKKPFDHNALINVLSETTRVILNEKELHAKNLLIEMVIDSHPDFLLVIEKNKIELVNKTFQHFLGARNKEEFIKRLESVTFYFETPIPGSIRDVIQTVYERHEKNILVKVAIKEVQFSFIVRCVHIEETETMIITFSDVTEIQNAKDRFEDMMHHDFLTGIFNRNKLDQDLTTEMTRARRYSRKLSMILMDIDHFKNVNDQFGHETGDAVLVEFARIMSQNIRYSDTIYRFGGEEFVVLLPETPLHGSRELAEKLRYIVEHHEFQTIHSMTASFGVSEFSLEDEYHDFFRRADHACYDAKQNGRNRVESR